MPTVPVACNSDVPADAATVIDRGLSAKLDVYLAASDVRSRPMAAARIRATCHEQAIDFGEIEVARSRGTFGQSPSTESSLFWTLPLLPSSFERQRRQMADGAVGALLVIDGQPFLGDGAGLVQ